MPVGEHTFGDTRRQMDHYWPAPIRTALRPTSIFATAASASIHCIFGPDVAGRTSRRTKLAAPGSLQPLPLS